MRKIYESPEAEVVTFAAMEQLALVAHAEGETNVDNGPGGMSGTVGGRGDDY